MNNVSYDYFYAYFNKRGFIRGKKWNKILQKRLEKVIDLAKDHFNLDDTYEFKFPNFNVIYDNGEKILFCHCYEKDSVIYVINVYEDVIYYKEKMLDFVYMKEVVPTIVNIYVRPSTIGNVTLDSI